MFFFSIIYHNVADGLIYHECLNHFFSGVNDQNCPCQLNFSQQITENVKHTWLNLKSQ